MAFTVAQTARPGASSSCTAAAGVMSAATGIGPDSWDDAPRANESLGAASTLVMRDLNLATEDLPTAAYKKRVKALAKYVMGGHRGAEDPIGFTVPGWLRKESDKICDQLRASGAHIVGDLAELSPVDVPGVDPTTVDDRAQLEASVAALAGVLRQVRQVRQVS